MVGLPIVVAVVVVQIAIVIVPAPPNRLWFWAWLAGLIGVSCFATFAAQRLLRKLAPLAMLFKMSLVFPDQAPSRFGIALRTGTLKSLTRRLGGSVVRSDEQIRAEQLVTAMAWLNRHDRLTMGHSERVRAYSVILGEEIGLPDTDLDRLNWAALVHDIGKLDVPEGILNKPDRPTNDEWMVLRTHPAAAWRYVEPLRPWLGGWVDAATQHHERWDGRGYPLGLSGTDISLAGRIVSIADAFDVMTAARSYKQPLGAAQARAELTRNSGTQFDPDLVRSFLQISLGRTRRLIGPLGVLAHFPDMIRVPLTAAFTSTTGIIAAGAIAVGALTGAAAPREPEPPASQQESIETPSSGATPSEAPLQIPPASGPSASTPPVADADPTLPAPSDSPTSPTDTQAPGAPAAPAAAPRPAGIPAPAGAPQPTAPTPAVAPSTTVAPVASNGSVLLVDDAATTRTGNKVNVHVLQNDDFQGGAADLTTLVVLVAPSNGTVKVTGENLLYEPEPGFSGTDTMTYRVCSVIGACDSATVVVTVS